MQTNLPWPIFLYNRRGRQAMLVQFLARIAQKPGWQIMAHGPTVRGKCQVLACIMDGYDALYTEWNGTL